MDKLWSRLLAGLLTGLLTGLLVSLFVQLFYVVELDPGSNAANQLPDGSEGRVFSGVEALLTFALVPIVAVWLTTVGFRDRRLFLRLVVVAYLTVVIPLFGIGIGGSPDLFLSVLQMTVGGAIGGGVWSLLVLSPPLRSKMPHQRISSGKSLESVIGYSRAVRAGIHVYVAGTTGVLPEDHPDAPGDAYAQAKHAFEIIETALIEAGVLVGDVVRTRVFLTNIQDSDAVGQAHHEMFGATLPASAFIGVASLIGGQAVVEIEVDAVISGEAWLRPLAKWWAKAVR